jgi:hypothetical protein
VDLPEKTKDKVAIVGFADTRRQAPFDDDSFEFWGINALHRAPDMPNPKWDRWFQLHDVAKEHSEEGDRDEHLEWLRNCGVPVYVRAQDVGLWDLPNEEPFPLHEVIRPFPRYFNNTISYLIALAIVMGFKEIHVYGVDMATDSLMNAEYSHQRPSCEFFLGVAMGMGIRVEIPSGSDLLKTTHLYGFEEAEGMIKKHMHRLEELAHRKQQMKQEMDQIGMRQAQLQSAVNQLDGAMQGEEFWLRNWSNRDV